MRIWTREELQVKAVRWGCREQGKGGVGRNEKAVMGRGEVSDERKTMEKWR